MSDSDTLLLANVGTSNYGNNRYEFDNEVVEASVSPEALAQFCDVDTAVIAQTPEAEQTNVQRLKTTFSTEGIDFEFIDVELIQDGSDIDSILQTVIDAVRKLSPRRRAIILDITHSSRSHPMVFLLSVMQLTSINQATTLERIYYSRFVRGSDQDTIPVVDLSYLRTLIRWYDAFEMAQQTGTYRQIRLLLEEKREEIFKNNTPEPQHRQFSKLVDSFEKAQRAIDAGFPPETAVNTRRAVSCASQLDDADFVGPEEMILDPIEDLLGKFDTTQDVDEKSELVLTESELRREAKMVEFYLNNDRHWVAIECGRELMINRFLYNAGITECWLNKKHREEIVPAPGHYPDRYTHEIEEVQALWDQIRNARNTYAHAGFKTRDRASKQDIEKMLNNLCENIDNDSFWNQ
jgi:hypothetical protein